MLQKSGLFQAPPPPANPKRPHRSQRSTHRGTTRRGFLLAALSGLSEPVGGLIAWAIVASCGEDMRGQIYGLLFGMVAGDLVQFFIKEFIEIFSIHHPVLYDLSNFVVERWPCVDVFISQSLSMVLVHEWTPRTATRTHMEVTKKTLETQR